MDFNLNKIFVILVCLALLSSESYCQNNLSFSQTLLINSGTVPEGKTWKLEGILYSDAPHNLTAASLNSVATFTVNGQTLPARKTSSYGVANSALVYNWEMTFPLWLPSGTTIGAGSSVSKFSILEFSIIPE